ncbi:ABC transporter substrate-binding protein [Clostridium saccharobutylicum]|uniref:ABC-type nitrate/sulfonate/bicarbonate transport system, periplasmic component n=1 Tax=Clostridium saccharobutylicum DSM 13864 TaxID=1345695 RepID=U5MNV3_CLOSA|nr:ABC transporter substrate-binding protein [Clostridium saccharobutylicum]AGX42203.1 ABC-type nitrate/sulfonate/bicarbonate transport system, periplasmic component [Clostridium saccharobutylicum DSM 13864]AQR89483.1 NMT1/THI5 like protein [Clostridium saccharobutylicum]AQR99385.1 NMT1/THI5 like protein [Clostridium saccharobutylicum]AQS13371.1 NMT1/THI5 like protein [Clostridium saccharobutylicum]MBA2904439.1 NitT/TauT family transport system substrate-binding protein [Clostridium saccharobu
MNKNFKILSALALAGVTAITSAFMFGCGKSKTSNKGNAIVRLNEVTRSVFYAPMYVAISQGFFEQNGIDIDLQTGEGADKTMQAVLSNSADIGFCGPEQTIYINNQGREDYPVLFAQLTQRDGSFLVGRTKDDNFNWQNIKGKNIIGGRPGGVPEMAFEYAMKKNNINPKSDVNMVTNIDFAATAGAFKGGTGDYVASFEPTASVLQKEGTGNILASIGEESGVIPYTCYFTTKSYMDKNPQVIQNFTNAIYEGQQWFFNHSTEEVADSIIQYFPGTDKETIMTVIDNYKKIDAIAKTPEIKETDLNRLMDIIQDYDQSLIPQRPEFGKIVDNSYAQQAIKAQSNK